MTPLADQLAAVKTITLPPFSARQLDAWAAISRCQYVFYGGAASGGKSWFLRHAALQLLINIWQDKKLSNVVVGLFCEDYPSLEDRQIKRIRAEFAPELGRWHDTRHEYHLAPCLGSGIIVCRNLDDPSRYMSSEFAAIFIDELTKNDRETFDILRSRMRWPGIARPRFVGASNPIGVGVAWVKRLWVDKDFSHEPAALDPREFEFVRAVAADNPYIPPDYAEKQLSGLPEHLRKALLEGSWEYVQGAYFSEWNRSLLVKPARPVTKGVTDEYGIPLSWRRVGGVDWGRAAPWAALAAAIDEEGRLVVYAGVAEANWEHDRQAAWMLRFPGTTWYVDDACYAKGAGNSQRSRAVDMSHVELWQEAVGGKLNILPAQKGNRIPGWQHLAGFLKPMTGADGVVQDRAWIEFADVPGLGGEHGIITTLPLVTKDPNKQEDVDPDCDNHAADACRYLVLSRPAPKYVAPPRKDRFQPGDYHYDWENKKKKLFPHLHSDKAGVGGW